ncbi:TPA: hypothetical protein H1005_02535, partial [archaeon]|nr:hypothetical protein [Candidatus Naiadarchaeales archaeon SRR2090153.bin1042]
FVFIKGELTIDKLRADLEKLIGLYPKIPEALAIHCLLYVLPTDLPEKMPANIKGPVNEGGYTTCAVFIRGATNLYVSVSAVKEAGDKLLEAFNRLKQKYGEDNVAWRFAEAKTLLNTRQLLMQYDKELARIEFFGL